jgi:HK97 family phage prohead protease
MTSHPRGTLDMQTERNHLAQTSIDAAADAELIEEPNRKFPLESAGATTKGRARSAAPLTRTEAKLHPTDFLAPLEIKLANSGEISGYGSTFGNVDLGGDIVAPSAFAKSLAEHAAEKTKPAMLWQHDLREPIGVWTDAREDGKGLLLNGKLTLDTRRGAEARALAKDGALALSIGYQTIDADFANGNRIIKEARLFEVSCLDPDEPASTIDFREERRGRRG